MAVDLDNTPMKRGKYKGKTPDEISDIDPQYMIWAYDNFDHKPCTKALYDFCKREVDLSDE